MTPSNVASALPASWSHARRFWTRIRIQPPIRFRKGSAAIPAGAVPIWAFEQRSRRRRRLGRREGSAMAEYKWPDADKRTFIGKRISRIDGPQKVSGRAKYSMDINRPGMLFGKIVRSPHAHAKVKSIDTSAAEHMPGVKAVHIVSAVGTEIFWAGASVVALAAVDEPTAEDAMRAVRVEYEVLPHLVIDTDVKNAGEYAKPANENITGDPDKGFSDAEVTMEGNYGMPVITHCCLEPHGSVMEWEDDGKNVL